MITPEADIHATHAVTGEALHITNVREVAFKDGGAITKYHITGQAVGPGGELSRASFIRRSFANAYVPPLLALLEAGVPVPPDAFVYSEGVLVTDLKDEDDPSELYGKAMYMKVTGPEGRTAYRPRPEIDPVFLELTTPSRLEALGETAVMFADRATKHRIALPSDETFEFRVKPDGTGSLILVDLEATNTDRCTQRANRKRARDTFLFYIGVIRKQLLAAPRQ